MIVTMCFRVRKACGCARAVWELRQLASSYCSKPLPAMACSYYCKVKTSLSECPECLISPFILAEQINTLNRKHSEAGKIESVMFYVCESSTGTQGVFLKASVGDSVVLSCSSLYVCNLTSLYPFVSPFLFHLEFFFLILDFDQ